MRLHPPLFALALALSLCLAGAVSAEEAVSASSYRRGQGWSFLAGKTLGENETALVAELGWPGLSLGALHGVGPKVDLGGRFSFNYGFQGMVQYPAVPGLKLNAVLRAMLLETQRVNLAVQFAPGPFFYFHANRNTSVGLDLPMRLAMGLPVGSAVMLNVGLEFPMYVLFGQGGGLVFPMLVGAGAEYFLDQNLAVSFNARMGPSILSNGYTYFDPRFGGGVFIRTGTYAELTLEAMLGIGYRL